MLRYFNRRGFLSYTSYWNLSALLRLEKSRANNRALTFLQRIVWKMIEKAVAKSYTEGEILLLRYFTARV